MVCEVGPLSGVVVGAILSFCITGYYQWQKNRTERKIARMQVASNLRRWMREMAWRFEQTKLVDDSDSHAGTLHTEIPDFHFETSLAHVSALETKTAIKLLNLIHTKDTANIEVKWSAELADDNDETINLFRGRAANFFLTTAKMYKDISQQIGWSEDMAIDHYDAMIMMMRREVERVEKIEADRAAFNALSNRDLFGDVTPRAAN